MRKGEPRNGLRLNSWHEIQWMDHFSSTSPWPLYSFLQLINTQRIQGHFSPFHHHKYTQWIFNENPNTFGIPPAGWCKLRLSTTLNPPTHLQDPNRHLNLALAFVGRHLTSSQNTNSVYNPLLRISPVWKAVVYALDNLNTDLVFRCIGTREGPV